MQADVPDWVAYWQDEVTWRGFNFIPPKDCDWLKEQNIGRFPFWVTAVNRETGEKLGSMRLSPDAAPDLAIWVYPQYRGKGWGERMYRLALEYLFSHGYDTIYAGCFPFNKPSLRILEKMGFIRWPEGDTKEASVFDGSEITMLGFVCYK